MTQVRANEHPALDLTAWEDANPDPSLIIADGPSVTIGIKDGCLIIKDGPKGDQRVRIIPKVPRKVKRVMIMQVHGYVSLEAMAWMNDNDVAWSVINPFSQYGPAPLGVSAKPVNVRLIRKQALCAPGGPLESTGVRIVRRFITSKLTGQAWNAEILLDSPQIAKYIRDRITDVGLAETVKAIGGFEGQAASAYWSAWKGFIPAWKRPVPIKPHWLAYPARKTLRRDYEDNRGATDPVNAMLNYGYRVAETECELACHSVGLSPDMGIMHVDRVNRGSFALDLIECFRPAVDEIVYDIASRPMDRRMFLEARDGVVSVSAPLTHEIASAVRSQVYRVWADLGRALELLRAQGL